ncbi:dehydrogenase [Candidatus Scalindua japonica]|uniref:Dehydrogenase n=1 Tax=Candidatus Scalindua japonica TaxID=1284222 RepID=A0A286TYM2_9BACT|nr:NAD(P)/FAD-dependent oxidoreductase [Candidatus Scalindua japonica]GAX61003.1 dehydrogenase [Candidatus Scalindua japonica]
MRNEYDVVITGSGPSGSAAAKGLVNEGLHVLVLEKKRLPRYKICSGIIFKKSQNITEKYFGVIPKKAYVTPEYLKGVRFWSENENYKDYPFNKDGIGAPNVWRSEYDYWLVKNSGAEIKDCCALIDFNESNDYLLLKIHDILNDKIIDIKCKYLISAEGGKSLIRSKLDPGFEKGLKWFTAYQNYFEGSSNLNPNYYHGFLEPQYGEVYAWFSVKDGLLVFGTAAAKGKKIKPYLLKYTELLEKKFDLKCGKMVRKSGCIGNNMSPEGRFYLGKNNILLVGEAAGFLNAFGEGISCALTSGLFAAEAISKSIKSDSNTLELYAELTKRERKQTTASWKLGARLAGRDLMPI